MVFGQLPIGSNIHFGFYDRGQYYSRPIAWMKIDNDGRLLAMRPMLSSTPADSPRRVSGKTKAEKEKGTNMFTRSHLFQYLNRASGESHQYDDPGDARWQARSEGFLTRFTEDELNHMIKWKMTTIVPNGLQREFGKTVTVDCLVGIPSVADIRTFPESSTDPRRVEGHTDRNYSPFLQPGTLLRTPCGNSYSAIGEDDIIHWRAPDGYNVRISPIICLKPDTPCYESDYRTYTIVPRNDKEESFVAGIGDFLSTFQ